MGYLCSGIKYSLLIGLIYLTGLTNAENNDVINFQCPTGWTNIQYMCYKAFNVASPWDIADQYCKSMQSELAKIPDSWFNKDVGALASKSGLSEYWIGFTHQEASGEAHWSNGEETNMKNGFWANYNPKMANGKCSYEVHTDNGPKWVLGHCDEKKPFVCEKTACSVGTFMCGNSRCIGQKQICDGKDDCKDGSDEENCPKHCRYYETGSSGSLTSTNFPQNYEKNSFCVWKIRADIGTYISLTFSDFLTEQNTDFVEIFVGSLSESKAFFKYRISGSNDPQKTYTSPNNMMMIKFTSDNSNEYKGFRAKWTTVSSILKPVELQAFPQSNLTVNDYKNNEQNTWIIRTKKRKIITLQKMEMDLLGKDEVIVFDGDSLSSSKLATYKSTDTPSTAPTFVQSTGNSLMVLLKSRGYLSNGRFSFSYQEGCEVNIKDQLYGNIMSPGYDLGQNYPNSLNCKWNLEIPFNHSYLIQFDNGYNIDIPSDVLYIYNIVNSKSILMYNSTLSGIAPTNQTINTGAVQIVFTTNAVGDKKGFKAFFSIDCPDPELNQNTDVTPTRNTWPYGTVLQVSCKPGYSFYSEEFATQSSTNVSFVSETSVVMTCLKGGQWSVKTTPQCLPKYCGPVTTIKNGRVMNATGVQAGDVAQYDCSDGYTLVGKTSVQCQNNGQWEATPDCIATGCQTLTDITNGQVNIVDGNGTNVGSIMNYTCDPGYQIEGVPISKCMQSTNWSQTPPSCKILNCSAFGLEEKIPNSSIDPPGDVNFKESKTVKCDAGYTLNGTSTIECLADQNFSTLPTCEDIDECKSSTLNKCNQICVNTPGSFYCKCWHGYEMKADNFTCEDINECETNNGGCEQTCKNTAGSYECSCKDGYALYTANYTMKYSLPSGDSGKSIGDVFHLNHSCVPVLCPEIGNLANGFIQPQREFSHYGDTFYFSCKIGFDLKGASNTVCVKNGNWSSTLPTCEAIKCPPNGKDVHADVPYLGFYNFTCDVKGKLMESRSRQCLYDPLTDTYSLLGDSYVCEEIDCGQPKPIPGMVELNVTKTTYGSQYEIKCSDLYRIQGNSSYGNAIRCESDAKWNYGDLKCTGVMCDYPPVPTEGTVEVKSFTEGSIATYNCTKEGYAPSGIAQRTCVKNPNKTGLAWDEKMPTCVDVHPPTIKNGTCGDSITLDKYSILNISIPEFADNSESFTVDLKPAEAINGFVVTRNMTIVYTATDASGYNVSCSREIFVEDRPLEITCPQDIIVELSSSTDMKTITFNGSMVTVTGPGIDHSVTFTPKELNINVTNLNKIETIVAEASHGQKKVNCTFHVDVRAKACSAVSRPQIQHASWSSVGENTTFTCKENYGYPDAALVNKMGTQCKSSWNIPFTSCSRLDKYVNYYANLTFVYSGTGTISDSCAGELRTVLVETIQKHAADICLNLNHKPQPSPIESTFKYKIKGSQIFFHGLIENKASQALLTFSENRCFEMFETQIPKPAYKVYKYFQQLTSQCSTVNFESVKSDVFSECHGSLTQVWGPEYAFCVACPPGSFQDVSSGIAKCTLCPMGEYQDKENQTSCLKCPEGKSTYFPGGYDVSMCKAKCPAGFFSPTGVPPCTSCPINTYSKNFTICENCPGNTKGRERAASSIESCKAKCTPGSYSYDGYEPCNLCPQGFYSNQEMQTKCMECDDKTTTAKDGADNKNQCIDVAKVFCNSSPCKNGQCVSLGHRFTCQCSQGYTGDLCDEAVDFCSPNPCYYGGRCYNDGLNYKCNCSDGTNGRNCENIVENCKNETCNNHGICKNIINATECICFDGYGGDSCEKIEYPCTKTPCKNGVCRNLGTDNYKCDCQPGFKGENCEIQIDNCASSPCLFNSTCTNLVNDFNCSCPLGYSGKTCNKRAELCSKANCTMGICVPDILRDSYTCSCDIGYTYDEFHQFSMKSGNGTDNKFYYKSENISSQSCISKCSKDARCKAASYDETNKTCYFYQNETDACCMVFTKEPTKPTDNFWTPWYSIKDSVEPQAVLNMLKNIGIDVCHGKLTSLTQCRSEKQAYDKMRPDKYAMSLNLATPCVVDNLHCHNGNTSECSMYRIRFQCAVSKVMQKNQCEAKTSCHDVHCEHGGKCLELTGSCVCPIIYNQPFCRTKRDLCLGKDCGNGTCIGSSYNVTCVCNTGFEGTSCSQNIDDCKTNPCDVTGTEVSGCQDLINDYHCPCKDGYKGKNCTDIIDNCLSNPCLHQGTCKKQVNDFTCTCPDGWTGKRCEILVDYCKTDRCANNGVCFNLFKTYYCRCEPNTYGSNCSESVNICNDVKPCLNDATCTEFGGKAHCKCKQGFTGVGCQIAVDFCKSSQMCANGGTCITKKNSYECQCPPGFNGTNCKQTTNDCTRSIQTCEEPMPVKCPLGKTGQQCTKEISNDYDLNFYLFEKNGISTMATPVVVPGTNLSLSLWLRFKEKNGQGTFLNLFMIKSVGAIEEMVSVLRIDNAGVTYTTPNGSEDTVRVKSTHGQMNDGKWNLLTVMVSDSGQSTDFLLNSFDIFEKRSVPIINFFGKKCVIILGCYYDAKQKMPVVNKGFYGELSQVNLYSKSLDRETEVSKQIEDPRVDLGNILVGWGNYKLGRGVRKIVPSTLDRNSPPVGQVSIGVKSCPHMVSNYGKQGRTLLRWEPPQFTDYSEVKQNYRPGTTVLWGRYAVTYEAIDKNDNVALCNFMVYAKESNCTKPDEPYEGTAQCNSEEFPYYSCNVTCKPGRALTAPAPLLFTCGPAGCWHPETPHMPMRLPPCGQIKQTQVTIDVNLVYNIQSTNCDAAKNAMKPKLIETMKKLNAENGFILCNVPECTDIQWNMTCNDRLNAAVQDVRINAKINNQNGSILDLLIGAALDKREFDYPTYGVGTFLNNQFSLSTTLTCKEGEALIEGKCVECTPGYHLKESTKCDPCPVGTYQSKVAQINCTKCPLNHTTLGTGHMDVTHCKVECPAGEFFDTTINNCKKCDILSYQDLKGQFICKPCLSGKSTRKEGATSVNDCSETCPAGYEFTTNCTECLIGYYRENGTANTCNKCSNKTITPSTGSTSEKDCTIRRCGVGEQPNANNTYCERCPLGTYQPKPDQMQCIKCNANYSTRTDGSVDPNSCEVFCDSGYERVAGNTSLCKECEIGHFKDNSLGRFSKCQLCPNGKITEKVASTSEQNCTRANCTAGQYLDVAKNTCVDCNYGEYQNEKWQKNCKKCPGNYTTYAKGADKITSCLLSCDSGSELVNNNCQLCPIGYYRNNSNNPDQKTCLPCPDQKFVTEKGAVSVKQCTVANCTAGFYRTPNNTCMGCPLNEYQDVPFQTKCLPCASGFKTWKINSISCVLMCPAGEMIKNGVCTKCPIGSYRKLDTETCTKCPNEFLTKGEGATNVSSCDLPPCKAGEYYNGSDCIKCPVDEFQDQQNQRGCKKCKSGKYTEKPGTTSESECLSFCATKKNTCSKNETCIDDPTGFKCNCSKNHVKQGTKCIHLCDTNYCQNGATCSRSASVACACNKYYDGPQCQRQLSAKEVSKNSTHSIIGAVVGVLAGILIIILIITYVCVRMRNPPLTSSPPANGTFGGTLSTKFVPNYASVNSLASQPILDPETQVNAYTNAAYDEDSDPAIYTK